jgi:hypothetical protein
MGDVARTYTRIRTWQTKVIIAEDDIVKQLFAVETAGDS